MYIADLHCDLLSFLAQDQRRTIFDPEVRCCLPQLQKGNVAFQTFAIYTETGKDSVECAKKQFALFCSLADHHPDAFQRLYYTQSFTPCEKIQIVAAIENASGLCNETEPIEHAFKRFEHYQKEAGPIVYISLTWNQENRFGGGNLSQRGLKKDGELLLEYLEGKKIAIDLSHASDALAYEIFNCIDKKNLNLIPIASHSNFRALCDQPRNLPDPIAKEIINRGGVIGLNFFRPVVGNCGAEDFKKHVSYACSLGAAHGLCFGADFFYDKDVSNTLYQAPYYHQDFENAGCYENMLMCLKEVCHHKDLENLAYKNIKAFLRRL